MNDEDLLERGHVVVAFGVVLVGGSRLLVGVEHGPFELLLLTRQLHADDFLVQNHLFTHDESREKTRSEKKTEKKTTTETLSPFVSTRSNKIDLAECEKIYSSMTHRSCRIYFSFSPDGLAEQVTFSSFYPGEFIFFAEFNIFPAAVFLLSHLDRDDRRRSCAAPSFSDKRQINSSNTTILFGNDRYVPVVFPSPTIDM